MLNGLRKPSGLICVSKQGSFALGVLLHRLATGAPPLQDYPHAWQVRSSACMCVVRSSFGCASLAAPALARRAARARAHTHTHTHTHARTLDPPVAHCRQGEDGMINYVPVAVPKLDSLIYPEQFCTMVRSLLVCQPRGRATVTAALLTMEELGRALTLTTYEADGVLAAAFGSACHRVMDCCTRVHPPKRLRCLPLPPPPSLSCRLASSSLSLAFTSGGSSSGRRPTDMLGRSSQGIN